MTSKEESEQTTKEEKGDWRITTSRGPGMREEVDMGELLELFWIPKFMIDLRVPRG